VAPLQEKTTSQPSDRRHFTNWTRGAILRRNDENLLAERDTLAHSIQPVGAGYAGRRTRSEKGKRQRVGSRVENAAYLAPGTTRIGIPGSFKWNGIPPGTYWVLVVSTLEVPYLEMEFLRQHQEFIQEVRVGRGNTSRVSVLETPGERKFPI
jgi:hypothetical protein